MKTARTARAALIALAAALTLAACGDDRTAAATVGTGVTGPVRHRRIEHRGAAVVGGRGDVPGREPGRDVTVGTSGTGGGFEKFCAGETDISDASRPIKDEEATACRRTTSSTGAAGRQRRAHGRGQHGQHLGQLPHRRAAQDDLGAQRDRSKRGTRSTRASRTSRSRSSAQAPIRAPSTTSPTRSTVRRAPAAPTTARRRTTTSPSRVCRATGRPGLLRLLLLRGEPDKLKAVAINSGRRLRGAVAADGAGRQLHPAEPGRCSSTSPTQALAKPQVQPSSDFYLTHNDAIVEAAKFVPMTPEQKQKANDSLAARSSKPESDPRRYRPSALPPRASARGGRCV